MSRAGAARVREVRDGLIAEGAITDRDGRRRELVPVAIGRAEGLALRRWVRDEDAQETIETGLGHGISTLFICEALIENGSGGRHVAIDPYHLVGLPGHTTRYERLGLSILEDAGVRDLVEFYAEESQIVLPRLLAEGRQFDHAFRRQSPLRGSVPRPHLCRPPGQGGCHRVRRRHAASGGTTSGRVLPHEPLLDGRRRGQRGRAHAWMVLRTGPAGAFRRPFADFIDF